MPALALAFAVPALLLVPPRHAVTTLVAGAVLAWTLLAPVARPRIFDTPSMSVYVIQGAFAAFSAVALVSDGQKSLLRPVLLPERPSESGLVVRLTVAYPLAKRFRTGATLVMYTRNSRPSGATPKRSMCARRTRTHCGGTGTGRAAVAEWRWRECTSCTAPSSVRPLPAVMTPPGRLSTPHPLSGRRHRSRRR